MPKHPRPGQANSEFGASLVKIIGMTLDLKPSSSKKRCAN